MSKCWRNILLMNIYNSLTFWNFAFEDGRLTIDMLKRAT